MQSSVDHVSLLAFIQVTVDVELWDAAGSNASGAKLASATAALDLAMFKPFAAQPASIELLGSDGKVAPSTSQQHASPQHVTQPHRVTETYYMLLILT